MSKRLVRLVSVIDSLTMKDLASFSEYQIAYLRTISQAAVDALPKAAPVTPISSVELTSDEKSKVNSNRYIEAIKSVRERTSCSLKEAKDIVDAYRNTVKPSALPYIDAHLLEYKLTEPEQYQCKVDRKIRAIKSVRERTGLGLAEAKSVVEYQAACLGLARYMYPYPGMEGKELADHKAATEHVA